MGLWSSAGGDHFFIGFEKFVPTVGIDAFLFVGADIDVGRAADLGLGHRDAE